MVVDRIVDAPLARHDGKRQKARAGAHEGKQQGGGGQRIGGGGEGKPQYHGGVEDEIQRDVEKAAAVGYAGFPRHGAIESVQQPVEQDGRERPLIAAQGQQRQRQHADGKAGEAYLVGADPGAAERFGEPGEGAVDNGDQVAIKQGELLGQKRD